MNLSILVQATMDQEPDAMLSGILSLEHDSTLGLESIVVSLRLHSIAGIYTGL